MCNVLPGFVIKLTGPYWSPTHPLKATKPLPLILQPAPHLAHDTTRYGVACSSGPKQCIFAPCAMVDTNCPPAVIPRPYTEVVVQACRLVVFGGRGERPSPCHAKGGGGGFPLDLKMAHYFSCLVCSTFKFSNMEDWYKSPSRLSRVS